MGARESLGRVGPYAGCLRESAGLASRQNLDEAKRRRTIVQAWRPSLGAWREDEATRFRVWAPGHPELSVVLEGTSPRPVTMERDAEG
jgi:1,4-alpha-glucan branching enzyme